MQNTGDPRTQLWSEEHEILSGLAAAVPDGGTVVEIGTAEGGTALLMHRAVEGRQVKICTIDVAPCAKAYGYLKGTGVTIVAQPSREYARAWKETKSPPIDLLFIDGGHDLEHFIGDWNSWVPMVRPGGTVAIHDFDPAERGGIAHFAIRVGAESILRRGFLKNSQHRFKLLYGTIDNPGQAFVDAEACHAALAHIGQEIVYVRDHDHSDSCIVADHGLCLLLNACLRPVGRIKVASPNGATDPAGKYIVGARPDESALNSLRALGIHDDNITVLNSLTICYLLANALRSNYEYLSDHTGSLNEFLSWAEALSMFEHGCGESSFPDSVPKPGMSGEMGIRQLSRVVAHEHVRLTMLARIFRTFVDWTP
jgi:hypothetical protein